MAADRPNGAIVCGMGGSAIGGDVVGACLDGLPVPYQVVRGYELPAWVSEHTLVFAVSYSGNTEETLACVARALARGGGERWKFLARPYRRNKSSCGYAAT